MTRTESTDTATVTKKRQRTKLPRQWRVLLLNDDYTTMDFVVSILEQVFRRTPAEAMQIMLQVHRTGRGVAGTYAKQIAEVKLAETHARAQAAGFPLRGTLEEE